MLMTVVPDKPRVLIFSLRNIFGNALNRGSHYEFEDIICEVESADMLAPKVDPTGGRASLAMRLPYHAPIRLNPGIPKASVKGPYDILFTICGFPQDLIMFDAVSDVRDVCKISVCLLDELWAKGLSKHRHFLPILAKFDLVLQYHSQTVKPLSEVIGPKCAYFPPAVDALSFCPYPDPQERVIDVYSMGRRPHLTHQKLLEMARTSGLFYVHDTIAGSQAINAREHRALVANMAKRSKYFLVNSGKFDEPAQTGHQVEFGYRYFEGAASGAIMIGERPNNEVFPKLFDWPDAVTELPYTSSSIDSIIRDLDRDPERQDRIRRTGIVQALMRHDWVYRWETILNVAGLDVTPKAQERKDRLRRLAEQVSAAANTASKLRGLSGIKLVQ
jgi:hypothetical protein